MSTYKLTIEKLKDIDACDSGIDFVKELNTDCFETIFDEGLKAHREGNLSWLLPRLMTHEQKISYAIFAAEQVISIFEGEIKDDKRPREAIEAAKEYLKNPTDENRDKCKSASLAATAAAYAYTYAASRVAASASRAAAVASRAASYASYAATASDSAASAASDASAYDADMRVKILSYGYRLLTTDQTTQPTLGE